MHLSASSMMHTPEQICGAHVIVFRMFSHIVLFGFDTPPFELQETLTRSFI